MEAPDVVNYLTNLIDKRPKFSARIQNELLDIHTKRAALAASASVVALQSYTGDEDLYQCSGTIIESDDKCNGYIVTSANLIRRPTALAFGLNAIANELKIVVKLSTGESCDGEVHAHDFHYNLVVVRFKANSEVPTATLRLVADCLNVNPSHSELMPFQLRRHSSLITLFPGDAVIVVGRYFAKPFDLMASPGEYSLDRSEYDCKELFMSTCLITRCGDGGPLVNLDGEVIGIAFYDVSFTTFLPMNVVCKWWEHYKTYGEIRRPFLGMEAIAFHSACLAVAEKIIEKFPSVSKGVIVEKLFEIICDNVGNIVDLVVAQANNVTPSPLKMMVVQHTSHNLNQWIYWK